VVTGSFAAAMRRAHKDPIARLLAAATAAGVRFRVSGATFVVDGADALYPDDQACLRTHVEDIRARLEPPAPEVDLLEEMDVDVEVITDPGRAEAVLTGLHGRGPLGFDIETMPRAGNGATAPWITITKDGRRAAHQPTLNDKTGLDPLRATPRLASVFDPRAGTVYILDFKHVPISVLAAIEDLPLFIHTAQFEHVMLAAQGIRLRRTSCTLLMGRLLYGAERGGLKLVDLVKDLSDIDLPKAERTSDWAATRLSASQIQYAATDAVAHYHVGRALWEALDAGERRAFTLGNATVPAVAAMRLAGIPFSTEIHRTTIARWEREYAAARATFVALTGAEPPPQGRARSDWLEQRLPKDMLDRWPRTARTGLLRVRSADLDRLAEVPEVRPLLEVITADSGCGRSGTISWPWSAPAAGFTWILKQPRPKADAAPARRPTHNSCRRTCAARWSLGRAGRSRSSTTPRSRCASLPS
jgi:3'-5' exonuclease